MKTMAMNACAFALGLALLAPPSAAVASPAACSPKFERGWVRAAPPGATVLSGYGVLRNDCPLPFVVIGAKGHDFVMAQVHETRVQNGVSSMRHAKRSPLPAHGVLRFEPNGRHLMLMHPRRALPVGTVVRMDILLENGQRVPAEFTVRREAPPAAATAGQ